MLPLSRPPQRLGLRSEGAVPLCVAVHGRRAMSLGTHEMLNWKHWQHLFNCKHPSPSDSFMHPAYLLKRPLVEAESGGSNLAATGGGKRKASM